jgi:hypothetical protein
MYAKRGYVGVFTMRQSHGTAPGGLIVMDVTVSGVAAGSHDASGINDPVPLGVAGLSALISHSADAGARPAFSSLFLRDEKSAIRIIN